MGERVAGRELDAEIAERMFGWQRFPYLMTGQAANVSGVSYCPPGVRNHVSAIERVPPYSTDIAAAWLVVERMCESGRSPHLQYQRARRQWRVEFFLAGPASQFDVYAESAPQAICLAALKALAAQGDAPEPERSAGVDG